MRTLFTNNAPNIVATPRGGIPEKNLVAATAYDTGIEVPGPVAIKSYFIYGSKLKAGARNITAYLSDGTFRIDLTAGATSVANIRDKQVRPGVTGGSSQATINAAIIPGNAKLYLLSSTTEADGAGTYYVQIEFYGIPKDADGSFAGGANGSSQL